MNMRLNDLTFKNIWSEHNLNMWLRYVLNSNIWSEQLEYVTPMCLTWHFIWTQREHVKCI